MLVLVWHGAYKGKSKYLDYNTSQTDGNGIMVLPSLMATSIMHKFFSPRSQAGLGCVWGVWGGYDFITTLLDEWMTALVDEQESGNGQTMLENEGR